MSIKNLMLTEEMEDKLLKFKIKQNVNVELNLRKISDKELRTPQKLELYKENTCETLFLGSVEYLPVFLSRHKASRKIFDLEINPNLTDEHFAKSDILK